MYSNIDTWMTPNQLEVVFYLFFIKIQFVSFYKNNFIILLGHWNKSKLFNIFECS